MRFLSAAPYGGDDDSATTQRTERDMAGLAGLTKRLLGQRASAPVTGPLGIDLGLEAMHIVQFENIVGRGPVVRARASIAYNATRQEVIKHPLLFRSLIKRARAEANFSGRQAVLAAPSGLFRTMSVNYPPPTNGQSEDAAVVKVVSERLEGNIGDHVIDYLPVRGRSRSDERLAMVAISDKKAMIGLLENVRRSSLDVSAVEIGPISISRLVSVISGDDNHANTLVINSGRRASYLTLISGGDLLLDQEVMFGESALVQQAASALDMSVDMVTDLILTTGLSETKNDNDIDALLNEAGLISTLAEILKPQFATLAQEIKRLFLYAASETRGGPVACVYLLGSIARWPGSDELLSGVLGTHVKTFRDPLASMLPEHEKNTITSASACSTVVAAGAALRGMTQP